MKRKLASNHNQEAILIKGAIKQPKVASKLQIIDKVYNCSSTKVSLEVFLQTLPNKSPITLTIRDFFLTNSEFATLTKILTSKNIVGLKLEDMTLPQAQFSALCTNIQQNSTLESLCIDDIEIAAGSLLYLTNALFNHPSLKRLALNHCQEFSPQDWDFLLYSFNSGRLPSIKILNLNNNEFGPQQALWIVSLLINEQSEAWPLHIDLSDNPIDNTVASSIASKLSEIDSVISLNLSGTAITEKGGYQILRGLDRNDVILNLTLPTFSNTEINTNITERLKQNFEFLKNNILGIIAGKQQDRTTIIAVKRQLEFLESCEHDYDMGFVREYAQAALTIINKQLTAMPAEKYIEEIERIEAESSSSPSPSPSIS
jgi:Ran GTPase-activating protein (RanGAP) involved in mRNA processing and transport